MRKNHTRYVRARNFLIAVSGSSEGGNPVLEEVALILKGKSFYLSSEDKKIEMVFQTRENMKYESVEGFPSRKCRITIGDASERRGSIEETCTAYDALVAFDGDAGHLRICTSIVGLPPIYIYAFGHLHIVTSDIYLLRNIPGIRLRFDPQGLYDLCAVGYPLDHRTLFQDVRMLPAGHSLTLKPNGEIAIAREWRPAECEPLNDWDVFNEQQVEAFTRFIDAMDLRGSFLSLTAGLDTRAVFAALVDRGNMLPTSTLSGKPLSLDALAAKNLSEEYGLRHHLVTLDDDFYRCLPEYAASASRFSGGISSIEQATEVYYYEKLGDRFTARLSGNLGNQIGRIGTEAISMRNARREIINRDLLVQTYETHEDHWYKNVERTRGNGIDVIFLLQNEVPFSSSGNYLVGSQFVIQQSPYANRLLIENSRRRPRDAGRKSELSVRHLRFRDIRHRFLGGPGENSFQQRLIRKVGGFAASYPINWGWNVKRDFHITGWATGMLACIDMIASSKGWNVGLVGKGLEFAHITGLHDYRKYKNLMEANLKEFILDILTSSSAKESCLFEMDTLNLILDEHFSGVRQHYKTIVFAVDLCLAHEIFIARNR